MSESGLTVVQCDNCQAIIVHSVRHLTGCTCDPDAPTWVFILPDGSIRGGSHAKWTSLQ